MSQDNHAGNDEILREVRIDGVRLEIVARRAGDGRWELSVVNELGVTTNWLEFFDSAREALDAGLLAIETEGVQTFTDIEGFEYLGKR